MAFCPPCPYCKSQECEISDDDLSNIMYTEDWRKQFFQNVEKVKCSKCFENFYYANSICYRRDSFDSDYEEVTRYYSVTQERWKELNQEFNNNNLVNYLPNDTFKTRYQDSKKILQTNVSSESKMANIRPLIECFINDHNGVAENKHLKTAIEKFSKLNSENEKLQTYLEAIVKDTNIGIHCKEDKLKNDPKYVLELLEALFTKIYLIPAEEEKIKQKFNNEQLKLEENLQNLLNNLK